MSHFPLGESKGGRGTGRSLPPMEREAQRDEPGAYENHPAVARTLQKRIENRQETHDPCGEGEAMAISIRPLRWSSAVGALGAFGTGNGGSADGSRTASVVPAVCPRIWTTGALR